TFHCPDGLTPSRLARGILGRRSLARRGVARNRTRNRGRRAYVPRKTALEPVTGAVKDARSEKGLGERVGSTGMRVATELTFGGGVAELIAEIGVRKFGADVDAFLEAEIAAVAILVERAFETVDTAEDHHFLELGHTDADLMARFIVARTDVA